MTILYRPLTRQEITSALFADFSRTQQVTTCWRRDGGAWVLRNDPFTDDWSPEEYRTLAKELQQTLADGGCALGAFIDGRLKGFASVEPAMFGEQAKHVDLSNLHVSRDERGQGVGTELFRQARAWARTHGTDKLYISAHSSAESQAFYRAMGCEDAREINQALAEKEPFDCQLTCDVAGDTTRRVLVLRAIDEYNDGGHLIYAEGVPGAFARGRTRAEAIEKLPADALACLRWLGQTPPDNPMQPVIVQEKVSALQVCDADSDVLFDSEREALTAEAYQALKGMAMRSAEAFQRAYDAIADKDRPLVAARRTFYGAVPRTAREMYAHTRDVNTYYFGEIGVDADAAGEIAACRARGFAALERQADWLENPVHLGAGDEAWTLRKVCRRFIWHDRIHARAMQRGAAATPPNLPQ